MTRGASPWLLTRWAGHLVLLWLLLPSVALPPAADAADRYAEEAVKATFLYRFGSYVQWPPTDVLAPHFTIAVLGDEGVASALDQLLPGRTVLGRAVAIRRVRTVQQALDAQILYVGPRSASDLHAALPTLAGHPILLVTSEPRGLLAGSAINFLVQDDRVRFEVALPSAKQAGLTISAELLDVAVHVYTDPVASRGFCRRVEEFHATPCTWWAMNNECLDAIS